jgi:hypothetical protein
MLLRRFGHDVGQRENEERDGDRHDGVTEEHQTVRIAGLGHRANLPGDHSGF